MSYHVSVRLPDGRSAMADYRQPITNVMRRVHRRLMEDPANKKGKGTGSPDDLADLALIAEWLDLFPEQACTGALDSCTNHGPAEPGPFKPAPYVRAQPRLF